MAKGIAEVFGPNVWNLLRDLEKNQNPGIYFSEPKAPCPPKKPVTTADFLRCSDDDRAYFWKLGGDVSFSQEMMEWLGEVRRELEKRMEQVDEGMPSYTLIHRLMLCLFGLEKKYHLLAFEDMFYEFIARAGEPPSRRPFRCWRNWHWTKRNSRPPVQQRHKMRDVSNRANGCSRCWPIHYCGNRCLGFDLSLYSR